MNLPRLLLSATCVLLIACKGDKQSSADDDKMREEAKELARNLILVDTHVDLPYRLRIKNFRLEGEYMNIPVSSEAGDFDFEQFALASSPTEVQANTLAGKTTLPMGMENGAPLGDDAENVKYFFERGVRSITLTHGKDNQICDSSYVTLSTWKGLSPFGEKVVAEMNRVCIMVDISHVSDSTFYDELKITKTPLIASHSSCRHVTPGFQRNMSDEMIRALGKNGGVIQINFGASFLDSTARANGHLFAGIDHVGIGSNYDGVGDALPVGLKDVSDYPNLVYVLLKRGYKHDDIEKICSGNVFRVWNKPWNSQKG